MGMFNSMIKSSLTTGRACYYVWSIKTVLATRKSAIGRSNVLSSTLKRINAKRDSGNARTLRKHARTHLKAASHLFSPQLF